MKPSFFIKSIFLMVLLIFLAYQSFITNAQHVLRVQEPEPSGDTEEAILRTINTKEMSKFPGLHLRTETEITNNYTMSINIPFTKSDAINTPMENWIESKRSDFLKEIKEYDQQGTRPHLNIQLKTVHIKEEIYSLIFTAYQYTGGANGIQFVQPFTVDVKNEIILDLSNIIDLEKSADLAAIIKKEIYKNEELSLTIFNDLLDKALADLSSLKWSISNDALLIYFDEYEISAGAAGIVKVEIPINSLSTLLKNEIMEQLNIKLEPEPEVEKVPIEQESNIPTDEGKYIAITFDDGPNPKVTPRVLEILANYSAKATFFMLGSQAEYYPHLVQEVAQAGHELGNHSRAHPDLTKLSPKQIENQFEFTKNKMEEATGIRPQIIRPPYGAMNNNVISYAEKYNESIILWSVDSQDWKSKSPASINEVIKRNVFPGAIILLHDIHSTTADALPEMLEFLTKEGYEFLTVSELLALQNEEGVGPFYGLRKK